MTREHIKLIRVFFRFKYLSCTIYKNIYVYWGEFLHFTFLWCTRPSTGSSVSSIGWSWARLMEVQEMTVHGCWIAPPLCQLHFTFLFHLSRLLQAGYEHGQYWYQKCDGCASARHTGVKMGKTWQTSSQCSLWYWWYQNGIRWELRQSHFMSTAMEISWPETVRDVIYKELCLSSYRYSPPAAVIYQPSKVIWQAWSPA